MGELVTQQSRAGFYSTFHSWVTKHSSRVTLHSRVETLLQGSILYRRCFSLYTHLNIVSEWRDLWGMRLNVSKTKTMIVSRSRTMRPRSPILPGGETVFKHGL